jgi:hypothetical protein
VNEENKEENTGFVSGMLRNIQSHFEDSDEEEEKEKEEEQEEEGETEEIIPGREDILISLEDENVPISEKLMNETKHYYDEVHEVEEDENEVTETHDTTESQILENMESEIKKIRLEGNRIPKEFREDKEIEIEVEREIERPIQIENRKQDEEISVDDSSTYTDGLMYKNLIRKDKDERRKKDPKLDLDSQKKSSHKKHKTNVLPARRKKIGTLGSLYDKNRAYYNQIHHISDNETVISENMSVSIKSDKNMRINPQITNYLEEQRERENRPREEKKISYVNKNNRETIPERQDSGDEYESDRELSHV